MSSGGGCEASRKRGYARFGMDDGYLLGPREIVFRLLQTFAQRITEETR
jgi:hypothetical protein